MKIRAEVQLGESERAYVESNVGTLLDNSLWQASFGSDYAARRAQSLSPVSEYRDKADAIAKQVEELSPEILQELNKGKHELYVEIDSQRGIAASGNPLIELLFQVYDPENLGIIDYHSASRSYQREALGSVDMNIANIENQRRNQTLYNYQNKYQNIKSELTSTYLRSLIAKASGKEAGGQDLNETLQSLFETFFPDKTYLGVQPAGDGSISFPVELATGEKHDINELSSGEKEILYGYLRLRNSSPRNSTILLDEPELHLNPRLLRGLVNFYNKHLAEERSNQLWLVTHSDTLLRQAVGSSKYSVYHMASAASESTGGQAALVSADDDLKRATIALVGDLATYQPTAKTVILEGGGNSQFDVTLTERLFPEFAARVNLLSGGDKNRVRDLYALLDANADRLGMSRRFYAIVDKDAEEVDPPDIGNRSRSWDRYHIENYLLEPEYVGRAARAITGNDAFAGDTDLVRQALDDCASRIVDRLVYESLTSKVNSIIVRAVNIAGDPNSSEPATSILPAVKSSFERLIEAQKEVADIDQLHQMVNEFRTAAEVAISERSWVSKFPGRLVLKEFARSRLKKVSYEALRNVVVSEMVADNFRPEGMLAVIKWIEEDPL